MKPVPVLFECFAYLYVYRCGLPDYVSYVHMCMCVGIGEYASPPPILEVFMHIRHHNTDFQWFFCKKVGNWLTLRAAVVQKSALYLNVALEARQQMEAMWHFQGLGIGGTKNQIQTHSSNDPTGNMTTPS